MVDVSVLILAKNEERNIADCIKSCNFAKEIIVIDDNSTDATKQIAIDLGAVVINRAMNGDWGGQQTFAIKQAKTLKNPTAGNICFRKILPLFFNKGIWFLESKNAECHLSGFR